MTKVVKAIKQTNFTVYILRTSKNTLYTGQTNNLDRRLKQHKSKGVASARYLRLFDSFVLEHTERYETRGEAMKREAEIKKLSKKKKELLVNPD